ncbi:Mediator of RNA polymerase II transcription subunit 30 [Eumeta japonica]|uniref:Mediator of RNA polymerase II transcription subunit 30 n=1 Tax=Eumeta variegata TaxID=151549 RepID=A0A4C1YRQ3_EUMVA|nr:Mediator of RNA polymerase II transcription subunit 30 [Eumeta japonica]
MSGQGHQFPTNFPANAAGMRTGFGGGPMGNQIQGIPNQLAGVMGGPMGNANAMVGMGNQMVPPYGATMQNQMSNMGMGPQSMGVGVGVAVGTPQNTGLGPQAVPQTEYECGLRMDELSVKCEMVTKQEMVTKMNDSVKKRGMKVNISKTKMFKRGTMGTPGAVAAAAAPPAPSAPPQPPQNKEFNTASLCKFGQETVQDIVSRTQDVFQTLKAIQPPNGTPQGVTASNDKKAKMQEQLRTIRLLFKRLRLIYEKCNETCQGMEYTHMESLIPLKEEAEHKALDERRNTDAYRLALDENRELTDQVVLKNKQLKEVITNLRSIIWEINVMLTMRRS